MGKYIVSDPDILGGTPVIKGTRVPIGRILFLLKDGYTLEAINEDYPHIDMKTLSGAIDEAIETLSAKLHVKKVL
ncbi:DUF433 domain-containing protein [Patescibacteria group bacterium]|nr:DUF433 domain-containing protein [Patescibacteria group bacterium]MBU4098350.1 DUF433 domain-containing protein [Patescibacteria group bacterium]